MAHPPPVAAGRRRCRRSRPLRPPLAFDAICPHAGCTVAYQRSAHLIACPCHGSEFDAGTGDVIRGPATRGLTTISVTRGSNGDLYVPG
ncbi:MAG: Rieske (2Fe-2S) protein [Acidimicrobiales bacterium]